MFQKTKHGGGKMNINKKLVAGITASLSLSLGLGYAGYWYGQKTAAEEVVGFLSMICMRGAIVETPDQQHYACMPVKLGESEKKKLDKFTEI